MPELINTDSNYEFVPPHHGRVWPLMLGSMAKYVARKDYGVTEIETRDSQRLQQLIDQGHRVLIASNHCRMSDALVMQQLAQEIREPFYIMASAHLFRGSRLLKFVLRRLGAFSVNREGVDREAVDASIRMLVAGDRPLVVFPEGALSQANDRLGAMMEGISLITRSAARRLAKSTDPKAKAAEVHVVPVAIRYLFQGDLFQTVDPLLCKIEQHLTWRPHSELPLLDRIIHVGDALLGLKEIQYLQQIGEGDLAERLEQLINGILCPLEEEWLEGESTGSVIARVKALRKAIIPDMLPGEADQPNVKLTKVELDRRWQQLDDLAFAQAMSLFPEQYIASYPTVDRILETVERIWENLFQETLANPPIKAVVQVGESFQVTNDRRRGEEVTDQLECRLKNLLANLSTESRMYEDKINR